MLEDVDPDLGKKMLAGCAKLQKYSRQDENIKWQNKLQILLTDPAAGEDAGKAGGHNKVRGLEKVLWNKQQENVKEKRLLEE